MPLLPESDLKNELLDFLKDLIIIVAIVLFVTKFIGMNFQISGQSMYSSYYDKQFIVVDRISYRFSEPSRGDVVVFKPNVHKEKKYFLKRIIALPGESIKIQEGQVYLKTLGEEEYSILDEAYLDENSNGATYVNGDKGVHEYVIPDDSYFVMGDNRNHSTDSRTCFSTCFLEQNSSFIRSADITGKVWMDLGYFNIGAFSFTHPTLGISTTPRWLNSSRNWEY